ncbi:MAG: NusG domain II-containing protein [Lachnospiraceae bacterium]|nr:NusG domain II-containing protein [Lachnospiraceae bacterium]
MKKRFGKTDFIVLLVILAVISLAGIFVVLNRENGETVVIFLQGDVYQEIPLTENREIEIQKEGVTVNVLNIRDGKADMTDADCPDKLCVHQKPISKSGETIVCLPNKIVVEVKGGQEGDFDSMAR